MKEWLNEKDLAKLGLTQKGLERLNEIGALPPIVDRGGRKGILTKDFAELFAHLGASFWAMRRVVEMDEAKKAAYAESLAEVGAVKEVA